MKTKMTKFLVISLSALCILAFTACFSSKSAIQPQQKQQTKTITKPKPPQLAVNVTTDMDFFTDGYEIVTIDSLADGDTTSFKLKKGTYTTRYLAVDTPETSNGLDPWGTTAKKFTNTRLSNAKQIILERDPLLSTTDGDNSTFDKYGRLLAHVWIDGELLQYTLVDNSLAWVKYLYFDYKYNDTLIALEMYVEKVDDCKVHNTKDLDPTYDYSHALHEVTIAELDEKLIGQRVHIEGTVCELAEEGNTWLQDKTGAKIYIYTSHSTYHAFSSIGNKVKLIGTYSIYNGLPEISNLESPPTLIKEE